MPKQYTWIPAYSTIAKELLKWERRQPELIKLVQVMRADGLKVTNLTDRDENGKEIQLEEIDPFTFFAVFNRGTRDETRQDVIARILKFLGVDAPIPEDFFGIPVMSSTSSWFVGYRPMRGLGDVTALWRVFRLAQTAAPLQSGDFKEAFNQALGVAYTNINLTMGLFWIRPDEFLNIDKINRDYLKIKLPREGLSADFYLDTMLRVRAQYAEPYYKLSHQAWEAHQDAPKKTKAKNAVGSLGKARSGDDESYWLVGAYWEDFDVPDQTERFLEEGVWENGYRDRLLDEVRSIMVGDRIAIRSSTTQKHNLPFNAQGKTVSKLVIKAIGTVVTNRGDGRTLEVEWEPDFIRRDWFFYTNRTTVWKLPVAEEPMADMLGQFVFEGADQDYDWFIQKWWGLGIAAAPNITPPALVNCPYGISDIIESGYFLPEPELNDILALLKQKKNIILQGPPGVGKTLLAKKLAYALMEEVADKRIELIQFHQSYSYEDFVRGYRPSPEQAGAFALQDGVFLRFCAEAVKDRDVPYVFIIDEINRGNLSQIFGELLMLVESDKRGPDYSVQLVYPKKDEPRFYVPSNVHIIGLMNGADRSLALVDYALRRRFAFIKLVPQFKSPAFAEWLRKRSVSDDLISVVVTRMTQLNETIESDPMLGSCYLIGHSYFCPRGDNLAHLKLAWFEQIIRSEIQPLIEEYFYDNPDCAKTSVAALLGK